MRIAEIFRSWQGEGVFTGTPSVFVRASGCNLRCWFCDTPYTSWNPEGDDLAVDDILRQVDRLASDLHFSAAGVPDELAVNGNSIAPCRHVVLTGGEPMLYSELVPLAAGLRARDMHITVETAGTLFLPLECDLMSISPKMAGSGPRPDQDQRWTLRHERTRFAPDVIRQLAREYTYQVKFVIDSPADCDEVETWLGEFPEIDRSRVLLMPQGTDAASLAERSMWLAPYCEKQRLTFCPRRHIEWFGFTRGT